MEMADLSPTCPGEESLGLVRAGFVVSIFDGVIDPPGVKTGMQSIPGRGLIRMNCCGPIDPGLDKVNCFILAGEHRRQCCAQAETGARPFADDDNNLALTRLVLGQAAVLAVCLPVRRPAVSAEISAIDFDVLINSAQLALPEFQSQGFADFMGQVG
jgi:hypothetical protein